MTIGERIKNRRIELNIAIDELAKKLNKNRATIYRYESNDIENFPTTVLEPLAQALATTPAYLMGWDEVPKETESEKIIRTSNDARIIKELKENQSLRDLVNKVALLPPEEQKRFVNLADFEIERINRMCKDCAKREDG